MNETTTCCAACDRKMNPRNAYFSSHGQVCARCHNELMYVDALSSHFTEQRDARNGYIIARVGTSILFALMFLLSAIMGL